MSCNQKLSAIGLRATWLVAASLFFGVANLQSQSYFSPGPVYSGDRAQKLIQQINEQYDKEIGSFDFKEKKAVAQEYKKVNKRFAQQIKEGWFIDDDTVENPVSRVMARLIRDNRLQRSPKLTVISRSPLINALCMGEGSFTVTAGLMSHVQNESELAFALAHEMAHYELDHVKKRTINFVRNETKKKFRQERQKILQGRSTVEGLESLKKLAYAGGAYSREMELQADSLGLIYLTNSKYDHEGALRLLGILDETDQSWHDIGVELFIPLHASRYPFQEKWLRKRLGIYSREATRSFVYDLDSVKSHPEFHLRKTRVRAYAEKLGSQQSSPDKSWKDLRIRFRFEAMSGAQFAKAYDRCLFMALQLKALHPKEPYVTTVIAELLLTLVDLKQQNMLEYHLTNFTGGYHESLRLVNNFMYHIQAKELGEMVYHFLSSSKNFNKATEEHYSLLWNAAGITGRYQVQQKIKKQYSELFPKGKFLTSMK